MGIIICKKHGQCGIVETCEHIGSDIDQDRLKDFVRVELLRMLLCKACCAIYGFDILQELERADLTFENADDAALDEYAAKYEQIRRSRVFCSECVAVVEIAQARREG